MPTPGTRPSTSIENLMARYRHGSLANGAWRPRPSFATRTWRAGCSRNVQVDMAIASLTTSPGTCHRLLLLRESASVSVGAGVAPSWPTRSISQNPGPVFIPLGGVRSVSGLEQTPRLGPAAPPDMQSLAGRGRAPGRSSRERSPPAWPAHRIHRQLAVTLSASTISLMNGARRLPQGPPMTIQTLRRASTASVCR